MEVEVINESNAGETNGFLVKLFDFKGGKEEVIAEVVCQMDNNMVQTWDTIIPPMQQDEEIKKTNRSGKDEFIEGKFFTISRKLPTDEEAGSVLKKMIKRMMSAINAYYAFGSPFSDDG